MGTAPVAAPFVIGDATTTHSSRASSRAMTPSCLAVCRLHCDHAYGALRVDLKVRLK